MISARIKKQQEKLLSGSTIRQTVSTGREETILVVIMIIVIIITPIFWTTSVCGELDMLFHICFSQQPHKIIIMPILQMKEMKLREFWQLDQEHTSSKWWSQDLKYSPFDKANILCMMLWCCTEHGTGYAVRGWERHRFYLRVLEERSLLQSRVGSERHCGGAGFIPGTGFFLWNISEQFCLSLDVSFQWWLARELHSQVTWNNTWDLLEELSDWNKQRGWHVAALWLMLTRWKEREIRQEPMERLDHLHCVYGLNLLSALVLNICKSF